MLAKGKNFVKKIMQKTIVNKSTRPSTVLYIETGLPASPRPAQPGNRATGQPGNRATGQPGSA
jgi:hypothetical protein